MAKRRATPTLSVNDGTAAVRGGWCTPEKYTEALGRFDLDPFSNPRATVQASYNCMLERGDDGFGKSRPQVPGEHYIADVGLVMATPEFRVFLQPDYGFVHEAITHYEHTQFTALLRLDPSTSWFARLWALCEVVLVPVRDRIAFVPPEGVKASANPFPHGFYYRRAGDVPDAMRALCIQWPTASYPYERDPLGLHSRANERVERELSQIMDQAIEGAAV